MQRIKKLVGLTLLLALLLPGVAMAQAKIGFVNVARLISESPQAATAMAALQEEFAPRQRELVAQRKAFEEKQAKLQRDLEVMGPVERRNAESELRKLERELQRNVEELNEDANLRRNEELGKLQRDLLKEVAAFAQAEGYDLVIGEGVLFASPAVDITSNVLERLRAAAGAN